MVVEYIRYTVPLEQGAAFEAAYAEAVRALEADPRCLGHEVTRCVEDQSSYIVRLLWDSVEGHIEGFRKGPHFPPFLAAIRPFIPQIDEMRHYDYVSGPWRRD
jgi:heme-degrading monooxygenase HmoA